MTVPASARDVYPDTSLVCAAVVRGSRFHGAARSYCETLVASGVRVYMSQLLRIELLQAMRVLATVPESLPGSIRRRYRLSHWGDDLSVRSDWMQSGIAQFDDWSDQFSEVYELSVDLPAWEAVAVLMTRYHLNSYDALHIATAIEAGVSTIATLDADFARCWIDHRGRSIICWKERQSGGADLVDDAAPGVEDVDGAVEAAG